MSNTSIENRFEVGVPPRLAVGPMSLACVDATIELAYEHDTPITLIASRNQIECIELGGGYVKGWDTISFVEHVTKSDPEGKILIARDHGGPWQAAADCDSFLSDEDAIAAAKLSLTRDIESGFRFLHLDPMLKFDISQGSDALFEVLFELYAHCMELAKKLDQNLSIEIGTEEQQAIPANEPEHLDQLLSRVGKFCERYNYPGPTFVVVQTGTKVEMNRNIGIFPRNKSEIANYLKVSKLLEMIAICRKHGVMLKQHNSDYLSDFSVSLSYDLGIDALNLAPEFGLVETAELLSLLERYRLDDEKKAFSVCALNSGKWEKWLPTSGEPVADLDKILVSGHYVFNEPEVILVKSKLDEVMKKSGSSLEFQLKQKVKNSIERYLRCLRII
jgi:hypothetical protein